MTRVATIRVGGAPQTPVRSSAGTELFVANAGDSSVSVISLADFSVVATIPVGATPRPPAEDVARGRLLIPNWGFGDAGQGSGVTVVDLRTRQTIARLDLPPRVISLSISPDGRNAYAVSNGHSGIVTVIALDSLDQVATIPVGAYPLAAAVNSNTNELWIPNYVSNSVSVIDCSTNSVTRTLTVGVGPLQPVQVGTSPAMLISNYMSKPMSKTVRYFDRQRNRIWRVAPRPGVAAVSGVERRAYVPSTVAPVMSVIDLYRDTPTRRIKLPDTPNTPVLFGNDRYILVTFPGLESAALIDTRRPTPVTTDRPIRPESPPRPTSIDVIKPPHIVS